MKKYLLLPLAAASSLALAGCDVEQTKEGELPDVDVDVSEGQLPEYKVDAPDVDVETGTTTVEVPTVDVDVTAADASKE